MAFSKASLFDEMSFNQAFWAKALSHPAKIKILDHLLQHGVTSFHDLAKKIPLAKTTVSQHVRSLREADLIMSIEKYPHTYYKLNHKYCKELAARINGLNNSFL